MKTTNNKLDEIVTKDESMGHYWRMMNWVEVRFNTKKLLRLHPDRIYMEDVIDENWDGKYCAFCQKYVLREYTCKNCPLYSKRISVNFRNKTTVSSTCCGGLYKKMSNAKTWKQWLKYANKVYKYIEKAEEV